VQQRDGPMETRGKSRSRSTSPVPGPRQSPSRALRPAAKLAKVLEAPSEDAAAAPLPAQVRAAAAAAVPPFAAAAAPPTQRLAAAAAAALPLAAAPPPAAARTALQALASYCSTNVAMTSTVLLAASIHVCIGPWVSSKDGVKQHVENVAPPSSTRSGSI
jgi:uncharacterized membrane protein